MDIYSVREWVAVVVLECTCVMLCSVTVRVAMDLDPSGAVVDSAALRCHGRGFESRLGFLHKCKLKLVCTPCCSPTAIREVDSSLCTTHYFVRNGETRGVFIPPWLWKDICKCILHEAPRQDPAQERVRVSSVCHDAVVLKLAIAAQPHQHPQARSCVSVLHEDLSAVVCLPARSDVHRATTRHRVRYGRRHRHV